MLCAVPVDGAVQQVDPHQRRREVVVPCIELCAFFRRKEAVVTENVAAYDNVPLAELLAVQETQVGLLRPNVPRFGLLCSGVRIKAHLSGDTC